MMKTDTIRWILALLIFFTGVFFARSGQCGERPILLSQFNVPPTILLVGVFSPMEADPKGNVITLQVRDQKWRFQIMEARNMTGMSSGFSIIDNLFPRRLRLVGNKALIDPLLRPDIVGNIYSLMGNIYISRNFMYLSAAKKGRLFEEETARQE